MAARRPWLKPAVFAGALAPLAAILWNAARRNLGANPIAEALNELGLTALVFLLASLACTPLREVLGWTWAIALRRMLGLFAFFYGTLHFLTYVIADRFAALDFTNGMFTLATVRNLAASVAQDVYKRPFITVGFSTWLSMTPLALTSTAGMIRRLGGRRWNRLHRLIYLTATLGVLHYWWLVKADVRRPITYGIIVGSLLAVRVYWARWRASAPLLKAARSAPLP